MRHHWLAMSLCALLCAVDGLAGSAYFGIQFLDADTGRGVRLVLTRCSHYVPGAVVGLSWQSCLSGARAWAGATTGVVLSAGRRL